MSDKHREVVVTIPAGCSNSPCKGPRCGTRIYWVPTGKINPKTKKPVNQPVSIEPGNPKHLKPTATEEGRGVPHHAVCPDVGEFRRTKL